MKFRYYVLIAFLLSAALYVSIYFKVNNYNKNKEEIIFAGESENWDVLLTQEVRDIFVNKTSVDSFLSVSSKGIDDGLNNVKYAFQAGRFGGTGTFHDQDNDGRFRVILSIDEQLSQTEKPSVTIISGNRAETVTLTFKEHRK